MTARGRRRTAVLAALSLALLVVVILVGRSRPPVEPVPEAAAPAAPSVPDARPPPPPEPVVTIEPDVPPPPEPLPPPPSPLPPRKSHHHRRNKTVAVARVRPAAAAPRASSSRAPAPAPPTGGPERALLNLFVDGVDHGEILVYLGDDYVLAPPEALAAAGIAGTDDAPRLVRDGGELIDLAALAPDVRYRVDAKELALRLTVPPERLPRTVVDLSGGRRSARVTEPATSAFINYSAHTNFDSIYGYGEAGLSIHGALLFTSAQLGSDGRAVRGLSNLTIDDPKGMRRLIAGDAFAGGGVLGGSLFIGGLQLSRDFELDPYFVHTPGFAAEGAVLSPTTAEVYVNGALVRQIQLPPGSFRLDNVPGATGAGDVRVVLRDAFGRRRDVSTSFYMPAGLLSAGLTEYSFTLGFRRDLVGAESWDYGAPVLLGRHRVGFTDRITIGGRFETSTDRASGGGSVAFGVPFGLFELAGATSWADAGIGAAASATYAYLGRRIGATLYARWASDFYTTLAIGPHDDRQVLECGGALSLPLTSGVSLTGQASTGLYRDRGQQDRLAILLNTRVARDLHLAMTASRTELASTAPELEATATLTYALGPRATASFLSQIQDDRGSATVNLQRVLPRGDGWGYRLVAEHTGQHAMDDDHGLAFVEAQNQHGHMDASWEWLAGAGTATVGVSGGIVAIGGRVFFTRPVQQGFALVRVPGVPGVRASLDNQEVGVTDSEGDVVITDLMPYVESRISVADGDIPLDRWVTAGDRSVVTPYRGGVIVTLAADKAILLRGRVVVVGTPASVAYGELSVGWDEERAISPLGRSGEFELVNVPGGRHRAVVRFAGGVCRFHLHVPDEASAPVIDLGKVVCILGASAWR